MQAILNSFNAYVTYETGAWLFAAEVNFGTEKVSSDLMMYWNDVDVMSGLLMANYAYSDVASVTARISYRRIESGDRFELTSNTQLRTTMPC